MKNRAVHQKASLLICAVIVVAAANVFIASSAKAIGGEAIAHPPLPKGITSFGAAVVGDWLYVYGGHFGRAHHYSSESQSNELLRLNMKHPTKWETFSKGPRLQGLAMVAHDGMLYRVGGFTAHNAEGEEHDLRSVADFSRFDPKTGKWENLPPMPVPRSSHDAVVIDGKLYVAGGWAMGDDSQWHNTAFVVDLTNPELKWKELPTPPFKRRAVSLGEHDGKLYVMGGMQEKGGPTTKVAIFEPSTEKWTEGPKLNGEGMVGFGSSAFEAGGKLFVSTYDGKLQCLDGDGTKWRIATDLDEDRFFHRMLSYQGSLYLVGGASMQEGKRLRLEIVDLSKLK